MASDDKTTTRTVEQEDSESSGERTTYLKHGRTVAVSETGAEDVVEIRASSGAVELRVRITEDGPVLSMEAVKLELRGTESVAVECKTFKVDAAEGVEVATRGELRMHSEKDMTVESTGDIRINGKTIWLN